MTINKKEETIVKRTHDLELYLNENRYEEPKELFKFISDYIIKEKGLNYFEDLQLCDFGCAAGEFLYHLDICFPKSKLMGVDILEELIFKAGKFVPRSSFTVGSILESNLIESNSIDISFLIGVHSIFDDFQSCFENLINWTKPGGVVYVVGSFNPYPVDVLVKYKLSQSRVDNIYESGWNLFSISSVTNFLNNHIKVEQVNFEKFEIGIDLPKQDDPIRAWTFMNDTNRDLTNGLSMILPYYLLQIQLSE